ncbi:MAG: hypothetical protein JW882_13865 [Deltaproteobacteria bacterium]|nr:hypothetical protein [Deltaproteobacteria bacterium]
MLDKKIKNTLLKVSEFYDCRKVGDSGPLGYRRSTDLGKLAVCIDELMIRGLFSTGEKLFLDMGCADGRVNVLISYLAKASIGIEIDEWTLDEYSPLVNELKLYLIKHRLVLPPRNINLFHGDSMDKKLYLSIHARTGISFHDFDIYYTYLTMQKEFAGLIAGEAKKGAIFMVYGLEKVLPRFDGLRLLTPGAPMRGILAVYQKK